jgi:hypothetical protein
MDIADLASQRLLVADAWANMRQHINSSHFSSNG